MPVTFSREKSRIVATTRHRAWRTLGASWTAVALAAHPSAVLFSRRRFKQGGASYFRAPAEREQRDAA